MLEKAFNQLMSRGQSQCCVCSLFDSPSPFTVFDPVQLDSTVQCLRANEENEKLRNSTCSSLKVTTTYTTVLLLHYCTATTVPVPVPVLYCLHYCTAATVPVVPVPVQYYCTTTVVQYCLHYCTSVWPHTVTVTIMHTSSTKIKEIEVDFSDCCC